MLGDGALTFREFAMKEPVPLATIQGRVDALPPAQRIEGILVATVPELIARKVLALRADTEELARWSAVVRERIEPEPPDEQE
jgi:hypothetical protein